MANRPTMINPAAPVIGVIGAVLVSLAAGMINGTAQAIIIRHDRNYAEYEVNENQFPAVFYLEQRNRRKIGVGIAGDSRAG